VVFGAATAERRAAVATRAQILNALLTRERARTRRLDSLARQAALDQGQPATGTGLGAARDNRLLGDDTSALLLQRRLAARAHATRATTRAAQFWAARGPGRRAICIGRTSRLRRTTIFAHIAIRCRSTPRIRRVPVE